MTMTPKNEQKIKALRNKMDNSLFYLLSTPMQGKHTLTVEIDCGHGGGISQARIAVATIEAVDLGGAS